MKQWTAEREAKNVTSAVFLHIKENIRMEKEVAPPEPDNIFRWSDLEQVLQIPGDGMIQCFNWSLCWDVFIFKSLIWKVKASIKIIYHVLTYQNGKNQHVIFSNGQILDDYRNISYLSISYLS